MNSYFEKYLKYKKKYLDLKKNLNHSNSNNLNLSNISINQTGGCNSDTSETLNLPNSLSATPVNQTGENNTLNLPNSLSDIPVNQTGGYNSETYETLNLPNSLSDTPVNQIDEDNTLDLPNCLSDTLTDIDKNIIGGFKSLLDSLSESLTESDSIPSLSTCSSSMSISDL